MSLHHQQLHDLVVRPALEHIGHYSVAAAQLVMGTGAQESQFRYLRQLGNGTALGLWQMEPATHDDIWENYLRFKPTLGAFVDRLLLPRSVMSPRFISAKTEQLVTNLLYAAAMCRVHYLRVPIALPVQGDWGEMARYWKLHYNTHLGAGEPREFMAACRRYHVHDVEWE